MNVLSLFDGISCGQIALNKSGIKINNYFASEIDKYAIKVTQNNYPNTIQIGNIEQVNFFGLPSIDLLIGGSPCQGFSFAGKQLNFHDIRSKLFFDYVRLLDEIQPKYFLFENVIMQKKYQNIISNSLKVEPIKINSSLVSAQNRNRLYWTNIPNVFQPKNMNISLMDIIDIEDLPYLTDMYGARIVNRKLINGKRYDKANIKPTQRIELRIDNKANCITTVCKDSLISNGYFYRFFDIQELERLQTIPVGYTSCVSNNQRKKLLANAWTVDVIVHILNNMKGIV